MERKEAILRFATAEDLDPITTMSVRMNEASNYNLPFNYAHARKYVWAYIGADEADIILADVDGEMMGGAMITESLEFHDQPFCYVGKFWLLPASRHTNAARQVMLAMLNWAKEHKCSHIFITATAGLDDKQQRLFINLMKRGGLEESGPVMFKRIEP